MDSFKEFQGKSLDEAISEACAYFDAPREKLEIDIIQDSKSGIFGLVGARKAQIRARRVQLRNAVDDILGRKSEVSLDAGEAPEAAPEKPRHEGKAPARQDRQEQRPRERQADRHGKHSDETRDKNAARCPKESSEAEGRPAASPAPVLAACEAGEAGSSGEAAPVQPAQGERGRRDERPARQEKGDNRSARPAPKAGNRRNERPAEGRNRPKGKRPQDEAPFHGDAFGDEAMQEDSDDLQRIPFEDLDQDRLRALSLEVVGRLVEPIVGVLPLTVELQDGRVNVRMDCGDDSGLLIGREGQTLASLQYLASRMVSRGMNAAVRVQLDAGEYRVRQDEKLREMALSLAEKVRATGKSHSTRPLSSYHRRIVHVVLQDAEDVQTRSSGDGPLKRVVIQRKRG